jgi:divalent metal cation (Fe/Co/Zn/Cd) transporter
MDTIVAVTSASTNLHLSERVSLVRTVLLLSWLTVAWLFIDGAIGMTAGIAANSVALVGWGLDCAIQAAASVVIIWRFTGTRSQSVDAERRTQRVVAVSFFALVPYIVVEALDQLLSGSPARGSWIGIALAAIDAVLMPLLGRVKKRLGTRLGSRATTSVGIQNILCAYLSIAVLVGLLANAAFGLRRADPIVALVISAVCLQAGITAWRGGTCEQPVLS